MALSAILRLILFIGLLLPLGALPPRPASGWTLASALPGKRFANEPQGFTQVIAGGDGRGTRRWKARGGANGKQLPVSKGAGRQVNFGWDSPDSLGAVFQP